MIWFKYAIKMTVNNIVKINKLCGHEAENTKETVWYFYKPGQVGEDPMNGHLVETVKQKHTHLHHN